MSDLKASQSLRPTTSALTSRYVKSSKVQPEHQTIVPGLFCYSGEPEPQYLPPHWSAHIHPEGNSYFVRDVRPKIVTEAYLYCSEVQERISHWEQVVLDRLQENDIKISDTVELFLELEEDTGDCLYYFVDHSSRAEFWIEEVQTEELGLQAVVSATHLKCALEELYWTHVEHFPIHQLSGFNLLIGELTDVFIHGRADQLTSSSSTFPFDAEQCKQFLDLLATAQASGRLESAQTLWAIARMWSSVANHRFVTHYSQEHCRLSRDQSIIDLPAEHIGWAYTACCRLLFQIPAAYSSRFRDLWNDQLVYETQWRQFMTDCRHEWMLSSALAFALLISNLLLLSTPTMFRQVAFASAIFCNISVLLGAILLFKYWRIRTASDAAILLTDACKEHSGFQWISVVFSLPRAAMLWALGVFSTQSLFWFAQVTSLYIASASVLAILALVVLARSVPFLRRVCQRSVSALWRLFSRPSWSQEKSAELDNIV